MVRLVISECPEFMSQNRTDEQNALQMKESVHDEVDVHKSMTNGLVRVFDRGVREYCFFLCFYRNLNS